MRDGWRWALWTILCCLNPATVVADTPPSVEQVLAVFDEGERAKLLRGEIITKARKEQETHKSALAVTIGLWVPGKHEDVARQLQAISLLQAKQEGASKHAIQGPVKGDGRSAAFSGVRLTETKEIDGLLAAKPGDQFNLSTDEIGLFQKLATSLKGKPEAARAEAVSATVRRILEKRYLAYATGGLDALPPYARDKGEQSFPGKELAATTEAMVANKHFPMFFKAYRYYPKHQNSSYRHEFFWTRQIEDDRPMYSIEHDMMEITPGYALIGIRMFYIGHGLNTLQIGILCMPYRDGTVVGLVNQAFIDQIGRYDSSIARGVGRMKLESRIKPMFEVLQEQYRGKAASP